MRSLDPVPDALPAGIAAHRDRLRRFLDDVRAAEQAAAVRDEADASPELCRWVRRRSAELGLYRLLQPVDVGGGGLGPVGAVALHETVGASGTALGHLALGGDGGLLRLAAGEQRDRLLAPVLRGEQEAALAFTDARDGPRTTARRMGDVFVVSGVKSFVTGGARADLLLALARVTDNDGGPTGPAILAVSRTAAGVALRREKRTLDGTVHAEFVLADVAVPVRDVLGAIGEGLPRALTAIAALRLRAAATACGAAAWALERTLADVTRPHRSGTPLAAHEQVQAMLADSAIDLYAARAATRAAARAEEAGGDADLAATMAKAVATEAVARVVDRAIQLAGGGAVVEDHPLAVAYRRIRTWRIAEGTTEVLRLAIARDLLARHADAQGGPPP